MSHNRGFAPIIAIIVAVVVIVIGIGVYDYFGNKLNLTLPNQFNQSNNIILSPTEATTPTSTQTDINMGNEDSFDSIPTCYDYKKYFVVTKNLTGVTTGFLVKYKSSEDQKFECKYIARENDFEIKIKWAAWVYALENNFFIIDIGTGPPPRGLVVYDLTKRAEVYSDTYSIPIVVSNNTIDYWSQSDEEVTKKNCPEFDKWVAEGLFYYYGGVVIYKHVIFDLSSLTKKELGEYKCSRRQ